MVCFGSAIYVSLVHPNFLQDAASVLLLVLAYLFCYSRDIYGTLLDQCTATVLGGAIKPTTDGRWAHLTCAMWIPGL